MLNPIQLPIGLSSIRKDYHHIWYLGYVIRTTYSDIFNHKLGIEIWTEPEIFTGFILIDDSWNFLGYYKREINRFEYGLNIDELHPDMKRIIKKIISFYFDISKKNRDIENLIKKEKKESFCMTTDD